MDLDEGCYLEPDRNSRDVDAVIEALVAACETPEQAIAYTLEMAIQHENCLRYTANNDRAACDPRTDELEDLEPEEGEVN